VDESDQAALMKIASVQCNVAFGEPGTNAANLVAKLRELAGLGVELAIFPEAFLTGYVVDSLEAARDIAIPVEHDAFGVIADAVRETYVSVVFGFIGETEGTLFNGAMVMAPKQRPYLYKKTHLPELGVDKYVQPGTALEVIDIPGREGTLKLGVLICYDCRFPEPVRVLALKGADLIALPTNWPEGAETSAEHVGIVRAAENRVYFVSCNRVGTEHGFTFIGQSKIIDPVGKVLAAAGSDEETIVSEIDPARAREKRTVNIPGKYELDLFGVRQPDLYKPITENR